MALTTDDILMLQGMVNTPKDGDFGPNTRAALKEALMAIDTARALVSKNGAVLESVRPILDSRLMAPLVTAVPKPVALPAPAVTVPVDTNDVAAQRRLVVAVAKSAVGWSEKTGHNDGPEVDRILDSVGLKGSQDPYCAAFNYFCYSQAGLGKLVPRSAWSPDWVDKPTWTRTGGGTTPQPGAAFGIWFASKGRVSHTGLILEWHQDEGYVLTIEGNTSNNAAVGSAADREGGGVFMKKRKLSEIFAVRDWFLKPKA